MHRNSTSNGDRRSQTIVVVHGLWMTGAVFALQRIRLARRGYRVLAFSYPSMRLALDEIASRSRGRPCAPAGAFVGTAWAD
jgi:pimeloyl-ACP methyl ester carboxylesterase